MANRDNSRATWTGDAPEPPPRLGALLVLGFGLIIALGLFIWVFVFLPPPPRTHFEVIEITDYGDNYPSIASVWTSEFPNANSGGKAQTKNAVNVNKRLEEIDRPDRPQRNEDTLIIVLRSHAATDQDGICRLLINESGGDQDRMEDQYRMAEFLGKALDLNYQNTLIVADICDLHYYPRLGYIVNPMVKAIMDDYDSLKDKLGDRKLWVLCAADDGQRSFRDRNGKTLFQEGFVEALREVLKSETKHFSVQGFYERLEQYCRSSSRGLQTPVLIPASSTEDDARISWWRRDKKKWYEAPEPVSDEKKDKESDDTDTASPPAASAADASATTIEKALSAWEEVDALRSVKSEKKIAPFEIDPLKWRRTVAVQALDDAKVETASENQSINSLLKEMERLSDKFGKESREQIILNTWKDASFRLTEKERKQWSLIHQPLRDYMAFVADWVAWRDLVLSFPSPKPSNSSLLMSRELLDAAKALGTRREELNMWILECSSNHSKWLELVKQASSSSEGALEKAEASLRERLKDQIRQLTKTKMDKWTWLKEQQLLVLLQSPLLESEDRNKVLECFRRTQDVPRTIERSESFPNWIRETAIQERFDLFVDAMRGFECSDSAKPDKPIAWGHEYRKRNEVPSQDNQNVHAMHRWHQLALQDLPADPSKLERDTEFTLFYPGNPQRQRLLLTPRDGNENEKWIDLNSNASKEKRFNLALSYALPGKSLANSKLRWRLDTHATKLGNSKNTGFRLRFADETSDWNLGKEYVLQSPQASITIFPPRDLSDMQLGHPGDRLVLEWLDDQDNPVAEDSLPILFNAERIDVVLHPGGESKPVYPTRVDELLCSFPAIQDSVVRWDVHLWNKIPRPRSARVIVSASPNGPAIARSKTVEWNDTGSVAIEFEEPLPPANPSPSAIQAAQNPIQTLVFRVEELEPRQPSPEGAEVSTKNLKSKNSWSFTMSLRPENPKDYVDVSKLDGPSENQPFDLPLLLKKEFWSKVPGLDRVPVGVRWRRAEGERWEKYSTEIPRQVTNRSETKTTSNRPVLQPGRNEIVFECALGGYPRAFFYRLDYNIGASERDSESNRLVIEELRKISNPRFRAMVEGVEKPLEPTSTFEGGVVFPNWRWDNWNDKGDQAQPPIEHRIKGLIVQAPEGIDAKEGQIHWRLQASPDEILKSGSFPDRSVIPDELKWEGSAISFTPKIGEADSKIEYKFHDSPWTPYQLKISTSKEFEDNDESTRTFKVIMDREPPKPGKLIGNGKLRGDRDNRLSIEWSEEPDQGGSGIAEGYLAIRSTDQAANDPDRDKYNFESLWKLKTKGEFSKVGGKYVMTFDIKGPDLEKLNKDLPTKRSIRINALVLDKAGNFQDKHESIVLDWEPAEPEKGR